jgi:nitrogen fixation/metabolism regulation signal transduction histidine kinase
VDEGDFQTFLSKVASRLRHDLKGGLITLKMGLESLPDEEGLKPLLLEKSRELVDLSDKLVLLLRMGHLKRQEVRPRSLFQQAAIQAQNLFGPMVVSVQTSPGLEDVWQVDPDAVTYAVLEACQNASLAGAETLLIELQPRGRVSLTDDGQGLGEGKDLSDLTEVGVSHWARSGLGLAIIERCMTEHAGRVTLHPGDDGFTVKLDFELEGSA